MSGLIVHHACCAAAATRLRAFELPELPGSSLALMRRTAGYRWFHTHIGTMGIFGPTCLLTSSPSGESTSSSALGRLDSLAIRLSVVLIDRRWPESDAETRARTDDLSNG